MAVKPADHLSNKEAAELIGCHYETVRDLASRGVFTVSRPLGVGRGRRGYIPQDEAEAFRMGQEAAVAALRLTKSKSRPVRKPSAVSEAK